ncbi:MAG: tRNA (N(6)-L-threonylcarbamoyladenosine(37)-C(2))-methylthiotransferase MtaB [Lentisphaeria bacterium]|nr:tRNA (N(6)-L-threonylcarbamoyladenosine(37)-C(2))-methylthiotransferase MtaB [Lentisphaeria bacterium]
MTRKTAAVLTLGCRLNQADSALLSGRLQRLGFEIVDADASVSPNVIVVNSCAVTAVAMKKSLQALRSIRAENPQSFLVFTGCGAEVAEKTLKNSDLADLLILNDKKRDLENLLPRHLAYLELSAKQNNEQPDDPAVFRENVNSLFPFRSRATLKIQDGCSNSCAYCIVPKLRGPERSRDFEETVQDFRHMVEQGFHEIVLSGVNLCSYHCGKENLATLLKALLEVPGDWRIRLGSLEPGKVLPEVLKVMAESNGRICQFLHMPLQNGSDTILQAMNRHCLTAEYAEYVKMARELMPDIHIGTDLIVGFPGETEKLFDESFQFIKSMNFANIHVFPFSPRPGTEAEKMPLNCTKEQVENRLTKVKEHKAEAAANFIKQQVGKTTETVLVELRRGSELWEGWTGNYIKTKIACKEDLSRKLVKVRFAKVLNTGEMAAYPAEDQTK